MGIPVSQYIAVLLMQNRVCGMQKTKNALSHTSLINSRIMFVGFPKTRYVSDRKRYLTYSLPNTL